MKDAGGKSRGAAVIEFAVLLPLLALIVFGIIEFGFLFLANAAREGARIAVKLADVDETNGGPWPQVQVGVYNHLHGLYKNLAHAGTYKLSSPAVDITVEEVTLPANSPAPEQNAVRVTVAVKTYEVWEPIICSMLPEEFPGCGELPISEHAVFVKELEES